MPPCNTEAMNLHLAEIAATVAPAAHAILLVDQAGWHLSTRLLVPANITISATEVPRAQPGRERLAVHARQLALQPHLQILRRSRRPLLCGMEQARRQALAHHVHRIAPMGPRVLINGIWYNCIQCRFLAGVEMAYKPIESYGVIGDLHTVALVSIDASIDWCCLPQFDSPSIFAAILDERKGGFFKIASLYEAQHKQMYLPDSNVLVTRFLSPEGVGEVVDFMPIQDVSRKKVHQIVRVVRAVRGAVRFRLECQPAFDYARRPHQVTLEGRGAGFEAPGMRFSLVSRFPFARH